MTWFKDIVKRIFDLSVATLGLIALSPILIGIIIWIKIDSKGDVFYRGMRIGRNGKSFRIFKFRTMVMNAESIGPSSTSGDDPRITKIGSFMRKYKIDELPQLINVVKGEMSLVGPRPEVNRFVDMYNEEEKAILTTRPGITDWASLKFPNEDEILKAHADEYPDADDAYAVYIRPEKLRLQLAYVKNHNLLTDLRILYKTFAVIINKIKR